MIFHNKQIDPDWLTKFSVLSVSDAGEGKCTLNVLQYYYKQLMIHGLFEMDCSRNAIKGFLFLIMLSVSYCYSNLHNKLIYHNHDQHSSVSFLGPQAKESARCTSYNIIHNWWFHMGYLKCNRNDIVVIILSVLYWYS